MAGVWIGVAVKAEVAGLTLERFGVAVEVTVTVMRVTMVLTGAGTAVEMFFEDTRQF